MFLGNLSMNTERQARKTSSSKKIETKALDIDPTLKRLTASASQEIRYTAETGTIPKDLLLEFLNTCIKMLLEEYNMVEIINDSLESKQGLHLAAVEFQRDVLEYNFGIERNFGCKYLAMLAVHHPDDAEIIETAKSFMFTCMKSYVNTLKYRSKMYKSGAIPRPAENEAMSRAAILEFFEGCNALMVMPETKEELRTIFQTTKKPPNARIIEMQRNLIKLMGYNVDYGVQCLSRVQQEFPQDREVLMRLQYFMISAELACREATFSDEEREAFYKQIPPLMQHFPHIHVLQQRMAQHNHMHRHQQEKVDPEARAREIDALKKSGILGLMASPEGRLRMQEFAVKVQDSREKAVEALREWTSEKRASYFNSFLEHPLMQGLSDNESDPMARLNKLLDLTASEVEDAMKFVVIVSDKNFDLSKRLVEVKGGEADSSTLESHIRSIQVTLSSLANLKSRVPAGHSHHGHDHSHDHHLSDPTQPDISKGATDKMER